MNTTGKIALATTVGILAGAATALLFAPASGKETRKAIADKAKDAKDAAADKLADAAEAIKNTANAAASVVSDLRDQAAGKIASSEAVTQAAEAAVAGSSNGKA